MTEQADDQMPESMRDSIARDQTSDKATPQEVLSAVLANVKERASAGALWAAAVTGLSVNDGSIVVQVDPTITKAERWAFVDVHETQNLAEFVGSPFAFKGGDADRLRESVVDVRVVLPDGLEMGYATVGDLYLMGTGEEMS